MRVHLKSLHRSRTVSARVLTESLSKTRPEGNASTDEAGKKIGGKV